MSLSILASLVILLLLGVFHVSAYPTGADPSACDNGQVPGHGCGPNPIDAAISLAPATNTWAACSSLSITIQSGSSSFEGYLLSAFPSGTLSTRLGSFSAASGNGQSLCQTSTGSAITHQSPTSKSNFALTWTPPDPIAPQALDFYATVVQSLCQWNHLTYSALAHQTALVPPRLPSTIIISSSSFDSSTQRFVVTLSWAAGVSSFCQGNAAVGFFSIQASGTNLTGWQDVIVFSTAQFSPSTSTTSATIPLPLAATYQFRLFANSTAGAGVSQAITVNTPQSAAAAVPPIAPSTIQVIASTVTSLTLNWTAVPVALSYVLQQSTVSSSGPFSTVYKGPQPTTTLSQLSPQLTYFFQVAALDLAGSSPYSPVFTFVTAGCPGQCSGAGQCDLVSLTCICNAGTFGAQCQFSGQGAPVQAMGSEVSLGFFYDTSSNNVYFRALIFDLVDGGSVSITLKPGQGATGTYPRVYRILQNAWVNSSDPQQAVVTLSEYYVNTDGSVKPAATAHATLVSAYSNRIGFRQYIDVQWVRPALLNNIDSTDINIASTNCLVGATCGYFAFVPFGSESTADLTGSLLLSFNGGSDSSSQGYSGEPLTFSPALTFIHGNEYALAYCISGSNVYFEIAVFGLNSGSLVALMFGAQDGMTNAYGVLIAFAAAAFTAPSISQVSLSEIYSSTFITPTLTSQQNVQILNVSSITLNGQTGVSVVFVRPLNTNNPQDKVFVPGQSMYASYALFRTSNWGDGHSHSDAGQLVFQLPLQGVGRISVVTRAYMWQVYLPVIIGLGVLAIFGVLLSRDSFHSPVSSFSKGLSWIYHKRPLSFDFGLTTMSKAYSWFDFFTLSVRHALFDWTVAEYLVLGLYAAALASFIVIGGNRFGKDGGDGQTFFYFIYGHSTAVHLALTIIPMQRHSPLLHVLGIPFERALKWHRYLGRATFAFVWVHFVTMLDLYTPGGSSPNGMLHVYSTLCGFVAFLLINVQTLTSLDYIRRRLFDAFYSVHVIVGPAIVVFAAIHVDYFLYFMIAPAAFYLANLILRLRSWGRSVSVKSVALLTPAMAPLTKMELKVDDFYFEAGQYVLLTISDVSAYEEHPLSISSAPALDGASQSITLHALAVNADQRSWTARLAELAAKSETFKVSLDGPFGRPSVAYLQGYSQIVLVSGGIGATPMLSIALHLAQLADAKKLPEHVKAVHFVWVNRHPDIVHEWFPDELHRVQHQAGNLFRFHLYCTSVNGSQRDVNDDPMLGMPQPLASVNVAGKRNNDVAPENDNDADAELPTQNSPEALVDGGVQVVVNVAAGTGAGESDEAKTGLHRRLSMQSWKPVIMSGRPNLDTLFGQIKGEEQGDACVLACGPAAMMSCAQIAANKHGMHLHKETFYF